MLIQSLIKYFILIKSNFVIEITRQYFSQLFTFTHSSKSFFFA